MKISYSWLKDFVEIGLTPQKLADELTMAGLNVDSLKQVDGDWVYDIEVASNRPDWLSARGIAREVAAITNTRFKDVCSRRLSLQSCRKNPSNRRRSSGSAKDKKFDIIVEDKKGCSLYYGALISGVKISASPAWLQKRLQALGLRPVNNVVDITNYCLMEYGQPLHAFDFDKIAQARIIVRRARKDERITVIDDSVKELSEEILVIADAQKPIAVAGIMGGKHTEVVGATTDILLESACFDPVVVRRGSRSLGIVTDSSYRFERGVDVPTVKTALNRATEMICDLCGGTAILLKYNGATKPAATRKLSLDAKEVRGFLGVNVSNAQVCNILKKLGFTIKRKQSDIFEVSAPAWRRDVKISQDLAEEVARIYGYNKIPLTTPSIKPFSMDVAATQVLEPRIKNLLVSMGLKEAVTYSMLNEEDYKKSSMAIPQDSLSLENPLSQDYAFLRTTVLPSMLRCASFNINHGAKDFEIFEVARVFGKETERMSLGICLSGARRASWQKEARPYTLFDLKGMLETLLDELQIKDYRIEESSGPQGKGLGYQIVASGRTAAYFDKTSEAVKRAWGIKCKEDIFIAEVCVDTLAASIKLKRRYAPLSLRPSIFRDISVLAKTSTPFSEIKELIERHSHGFLKSVSLVEPYKGKEVPHGSVGLTISLEYHSPERSLTDAEINLIHQGLLKKLVDELSLKLR